MGIESYRTFRVMPNEHVDYMKAVPLSEVTFKEEALALHQADENGALQVIEEAASVSTEQLLADMAGAEICIVEIDEEKIGYFIGGTDNGFYLGPEVDLEFLKENKPDVFENIKTEGSFVGGAQPQMQPQIAAAPNAFGSGGAPQVVQGGEQIPPQTTQQGGQVGGGFDSTQQGIVGGGQAAGGMNAGMGQQPPGAPPIASGAPTGQATGQSSISPEDIMNFVRTHKQNQQNDGGNGTDEA